MQGSGQWSVWSFRPQESCTGGGVCQGCLTSKVYVLVCDKNGSFRSGRFRSGHVQSVTSSGQGAGDEGGKEGGEQQRKEGRMKDKVGRKKDKM